MKCGAVLFIKTIVDMFLSLITCHAHKLTADCILYSLVLVFKFKLYIQTIKLQNSQMVFVTYSAASH